MLVYSNKVFAPARLPDGSHRAERRRGSHTLPGAGGTHAGGANRGSVKGKFAIFEPPRLPKKGEKWWLNHVESSKSGIFTGEPWGWMWLKMGYSWCSSILCNFWWEHYYYSININHRSLRYPILTRVKMKHPRPRIWQISSTIFCFNAQKDSHKVQNPGHGVVPRQVQFFHFPIIFKDLSIFSWFSHGFPMFFPVISTRIKGRASRCRCIEGRRSWGHGVVVLNTLGSNGTWSEQTGDGSTMLNYLWPSP